ncbi:MAG: hypothetical protein ISR77_19575 [Pirellulaceae bacterium]|nr:hypothetical protein [Pirellulaceae bacterium]
MPSKTRRKKNTRKISGPDDWDSWSFHLTSRVTPINPLRLIPAKKKSPLRWATTKDTGGAAQQLIKKVNRWVRGKEPQVSDLVESLEEWLAAAEGRPVCAGFGLEALAWTYILPRLASSLPAAPWCQVFDYLSELPRRIDGAETSDKPLEQQLIGGELPLVLSYLFPEVNSCCELGKIAQERLSSGVNELLDGNGLPTAGHLALLRPLLACWTRCGYLARAAGVSCFDEKARLQYEWLVRRALQLTRQDGTQVFSVCTDEPEKGIDELLDAALMLIGDQEDNAIADQVLPGRKALRKKSQSGVYFPDASTHSKWGEIAILRPNWLRGGEHLVVTYKDRAVRTELNCGSSTIWSGPWSARITVDGKPLDLQSDWHQNCWYSDDDVDYLELEAKLDNGWRLERQMLLAREDHFLLVADVLLGSAEADIEYRNVFPLTDGIRFEAAEETHDGYLVANRRLALVMPLALPEWRVAKTDGTLEATADGLELRQKARAARLYAPLFIDLDRKRLKKPLTWRQLTVGEELQAQPPSAAVGYRVQVGAGQWLFYRSLTPPANRTVLGQNLYNEFYAGRFDTDGEVDELIAINSEE